MQLSYTLTGRGEFIHPSKDFNGEPVTPRTRQVSFHLKKNQYQEKNQLVKKVHQFHKNLLEFIKEKTGFQDLTKQDILALAFPRDHMWTKIIKSHREKCNPQQLTLRILESGNIESEEQRQQIALTYKKVCETRKPLTEAQKNILLPDGKLSDSQKIWGACQQYFASEIIKFARIMKGKQDLGNTLDLLCETGATTAQLKSEGNSNVKCLDIDPVIQFLGTQMHDNISQDDLILEYFEDYQTDKKYDTIISHPFFICTDNKEYSEIFVNKFNELLAKDGIIILGCAQNTPDTLKKRTLPQALEKKFDVEYCTFQDRMIAGLETVMVLRKPKETQSHQSDS